MQEETFWKIVKSQGEVVDTQEDGTTTIELGTAKGRSQLVRIAVKDLGGNFGPCAVFGTLIGEADKLDCDKALRLNASIVKFGAIAIMDDMAVLRENLRLATCDADEIRFTIAELAGIADALEEHLYGTDRF